MDFVWLLQLKLQTGLVQKMGAEFEGHPVVQVWVVFDWNHTTTLGLHHLSVYLQIHLDTHTWITHKCYISTLNIFLIIYSL